MGTSFRAVLGSGAGSQWTGWGQGASVSTFSSATPTLSLSGETATGSMGMDFERGPLLTGFAMTHSLGEGTAQGAGRSYALGSAVTTMLPYADPARGLDMALRLHGLAAHAKDGYSERGVSGSLRLVPGAAGRGLSASLTPSWGVDPCGSGRLWMLPDASGLAANDGAVPSGRLDTEVGYGLGAPAGLGVATPYAGLGLAGNDARTWRAGARWAIAPEVTLGLEGTQSESADGAPEHGLLLHGSVRW